VVEIDKGPIKPGKHRDRLVVRPREAATKQGNFEGTKLFQSLVEGVHEVEVDITIVLVVWGPKKVKVPNENPGPGDRGQD
jgi:hypothetical protein